MKKHIRIICGAAALVLILSLAGCVEDKPSVQAVSPAQNVEVPSDSGKEEPKQTERTPGFSKEDIALDLDGLDMKLGVNIKDVISELGEEYDYSEAISCAYDGMDKTYIYPGVELFTYPDKDKDFLFEATLVDDTYSTAAGLKVGCTEEEIKACYGENCFKEGIVLRYNTSNNPDNTDEPSLYFVIEDGKATSIGIALGERE